MSTTSINLRPQAVSTFMSKGKRPAQEDFVLADRDKGVFIVADGFGGPIPGAEASKTACESVRNFLFKEIGDRDATLPFVLKTYFSLAGNVLFNSLIHANRKLMAWNKGRNVHEKGGASVIAGFVDGNLLAIANVGACTGWLFREGKAVELVIPRVFGKLTNPFQNEMAEEFKAPLMALGMSEDLEPEIVEYRISKGDWLVFQTDGFSNALSRTILEVKNKNLDPTRSVEEVNSRLNHENYNDNAALALIVF